MFALKLAEVPEGTATTLVGKVLKLKTLPATIGRGKDATIVVKHRKLSRLHCRFYVSDEKLHVRDLGSTNGTAVNGTPITGAVLLKVGDLVSVGGVVFQVGRFVSTETESPNAMGPSEEPTATTPVVETKPPQPLIHREVLPVEASEPIGTETVDWKPEPTLEATALASQSPNGLLRTQDHHAPVAPGSAVVLDWESPVPSASVSSVHIESSALHAGSVDVADLPNFAEVPRVEIDPQEIDLADVASVKKDASVTALGNFFSQQNLRRS
jgi:pSer/pThr/pTyr-binding forkhead associated (FHA) protein